VSGGAGITGTAILAGGLSTRMGSNKALLRPAPGGPTLVETVAARIAEAGLSSPLLVINTPEELAFLGLPMAPDEVTSAGPLGGILTALMRSGHARVLVVACDMPLLNPALLAYMASLPDTHDALVPRWTDPGGVQRFETLHAVYSRRCIEPIRKRIEAGRLKAASLLDDLSVRYLEEDELRPLDPGLASFRNVNTPEDWNALIMSS
jgi:molybdenum cofactor guanylyltransferase